MIRNTFQTTEIDTKCLQLVNSRNLLHHTKFGFYQLQSFLFIVVIVRAILIKTIFSSDFNP